jgi:hypothetical protein
VDVVHSPPLKPPLPLRVPLPSTTLVAAAACPVLTSGRPAGPVFWRQGTSRRRWAVLHPRLPRAVHCRLLRRMVARSDPPLSRPLLQFQLPSPSWWPMLLRLLHLQLLTPPWPSLIQPLPLRRPVQVLWGLRSHSWRTLSAQRSFQLRLPPSQLLCQGGRTRAAQRAPPVRSQRTGVHTARHGLERPGDLSVFCPCASHAICAQSHIQ